MIYLLTRMSAEPAVLARNTSYLTLALVGQKIISFLYFTYLARIFGPEDVGRYVFALSVTTLFSVFLDLGLANVLTREVAREPGSAGRLFGLTLAYKSMALAAVVGGVVGYAFALGYPAPTRQLIYLACAVMVLDSVTLAVYSVLRGLHTLVWESIGTVLMQATVAVLGVAVSLYTRDLRWFMLALMAAAFTNMAFSLWRLKASGMSLGFRFSRSEFAALARIAWPFALAAILTRLYGYVDNLFLSYFGGDRAVGIYSVAYKVTFALQFIPAAFSASLLPGFSTYFVSAPEKLADTFGKALTYLMAIAVPVSLGIIAIAPEVLAWLYPRFGESLWPLRILMFSLMFLFATFPMGALLPAVNRQERNTFNIGLAAVSAVVLNALLVPRFGPTGAAVSSLVSTLVLLAAHWQAIGRSVVFSYAKLFGRLFRVALAGIAMFALAMYLKTFVHVTLVVPVAGVAYATMLLLFRGITWEELRGLGRIVFRRKPATV